MKKVAVGCLLALGLLVAVLILVPVIIIATSGPADRSVLHLKIQGTILEERPNDFLSQLFMKKTATFRDYLDALKKAGSDDQITGLFIEVGRSSLGWGKVQELRDGIQAFRDQGKWTAAFMETAGEFSPGGLTYYLATACDEIFLAPPGLLNLIGLHAEIPFIRGTLDKLKIYPDMDAIGEYKTFKNTYTETDFTPTHRESVESLLDSLYGQLLEGIAMERGMEEAELAKTIDHGPFLAREAFEEGFVDDLLYHDEVKDKLKEKNGGTLPFVTLPKYLKRHRPGAKGKYRIALIYGVGTIIRGESGYDSFSHEQYMGSVTIAGAIRKAGEDPGVSAIVFRIDSPGGSSLASDLIRREVELAAAEKPLVISMSDLGASGGYLVAMPANLILAQPGTLTGSIGVVAGKFNMKGFYNMFGLTKGIVNRGRNAAFFSTYQNFTSHEREVFKKMIGSVYDDFVTGVAESRGMEWDEADRIARGRVYTGKDALELGLIDELGGLELAIQRARELAEIPADAAVRIDVLPRPKSLMQSLRKGGIHLPPSLRAWIRLAGELPVPSADQTDPFEFRMPEPTNIQ